MESFEELEVAPELIEALAAEGIERPTPLQKDALPVIRKGNNIVLAAGPGSGVLVAWCVPLLERLGEQESDGPRVLVLTASAETADRLAESAARLAGVTGLAVAALGSPWLLPGRAHIVLGTPADVLAAISQDLDLSQLGALVVDQAQLIEKLTGLEPVEHVIDYIPADAQRILTALPVTEGLSDLVERHFKRAPTIPPKERGDPPSRGGVRFRIVAEPKDTAALLLAEELLAAEARHVLFYTRSEDRAADLGDYLTLHGYVAGAPGDTSTPVWLGVDALAARAAAQGVDGVVVVSHDVPPDPDTLDRRHSLGSEGVVLLLPREVTHLKTLGRRTGYETVPFPPPAARRTPTVIEELRASLARAVEEGDAAPWLPVLGPLFERFDPAEVAAAAVALLRARATPPPSLPTEARASSSAPAAGPAWAKLFVAVGERDGLRPGDLLGAITGEAGVDGRSVGKIEIRESHTLVEVHDDVAQRVIKALNGTTIKGRAVRADFDRPRRGGPRPSRSR